MKPQLRRWLFWWSLLGLIVPAALLLHWRLSGAAFGRLEVILWPSSITLMGLEGQNSVFTIILVYAIAFIANVIIYAIAGLLIWAAMRTALPRSRQAG